MTTSRRRDSTSQGTWGTYDILLVSEVVLRLMCNNLLVKILSCNLIIMS